MQRKGRGGPTFRSRRHLKIAPAKYPPVTEKTIRGIVEDILHEPGRWTPLAKIRVIEDGSIFYVPAAEGLFIGQTIFIGPEAEPRNGNVLPLEKIPEGTQVFNVELREGDGGKLARQAGSYAVLIGKTGQGKVVLLLPSGKTKEVDGKARATIGIPASGGKIEKPLLKAGAAYHKWKPKARKWPIVRGVAMNAASHPWGGGSHQSEGKPTTVSRNAPPGRKVGHIAARRTGRRKR